jgi:hypothetical protein
MAVVVVADLMPAVVAVVTTAVAAVMEITVAQVMEVPGAALLGRVVFRLPVQPELMMLMVLYQLHFN